MPLELNYDDLINLIKTVSTSSLKNFSLEQNDLKILMEASDPAVRVPPEAQIDSVRLPDAFREVAVSAEAHEDPENPEDHEWCIKAPLVGTFYRSPEIDMDPYVSEGDHVKKGQPLGIIEAMKLFNEIESDVDGVIEKILVDDGQVVGFNDVLFVIKV